MNNRLPRVQREALDRQDAQYLKQPLVLGRDPRSAGAHVRHLVKLMRSKRSASPCSDAMAHIHALFDRTINAVVPPAAAARVACKKGCSHCCVQPVGITAAETFYLARTLRQREPMVAALLEAGKRIAATPKTQRLFNMRCPMLVDNACSVYDERPLACHNFVSFNVNACITKYVMLGNSDIRGPEEHVPVINGCRMVLYASFGVLGRKDFTAGYEMKAALAHVLQLDEGAEARWLAGEDVMAGVDLLPEVEGMFSWDIGRMISALAPTL